jgi:Fe-S-cluster-containing hydrogenase component 2
MPDQPSQPSGSRDDLRIEQSRCLPNRYSESECRRCVTICPRQAISVDDGLRVNPERCTGCLLCTTVCPSGALEINHQFDACLAALRKVENPVLGCCRTSASANASLVCLGGLSDEHLLSLIHSLTGSLQLNLSSCQGCRNSPMLDLLLERLRRLSDLNGDQNGCRIIIAEDGAAVQVQQERLNRRSFFGSFRAALFQSAAAVMDAAHQTVERRSEYAEKRVPERRQLLNRTLRNLPAERGQRIAHQYSHHLAFNENCSACQGCVAICPSGALTTVTRDQQPAFIQENCTGCGLCVEFCLDQAIQLSSPHNERRPG